MRRSERRVGHLDHPALLYRSREELLASMVPYVSAGVDRDEVVFVATREGNIDALREALGDRAGAVTLVDTDLWHPHPASRLRAFHDLVIEELAAGATSLRLTGEPVWPDGPEEEVREWQRYESVLNRVLAPFPATLVCLYDAVRLDPSVVASARRTHPRVLEGRRERISDDFEEPEEFLAQVRGELSPPPPAAVRMTGRLELGPARRFLAELARGAGLSDTRISDLTVAANEVLTNAVAHGGGVAELWAWGEEGTFVCQIEDRGRGIADPLAGYRPPSSTAAQGRGLWVARQLVDLMEIGSAGDGAIVRLHVRWPGHDGASAGHIGSHGAPAHW